MPMSVCWLLWGGQPCAYIFSIENWKLINPQYRSISSDIFNLLKDQDPGPLIVQQSRLLEQIYGTNVTSLLLNGSPLCLKSIKKTLLKELCRHCLILSPALFGPALYSIFNIYQFLIYLSPLFLCSVLILVLVSALNMLLPTMWLTVLSEHDHIYPM